MGYLSSLLEMSGFPQNENYWQNQDPFYSWNYNQNNANSGFHSELTFQDTSQYENVPSDPEYKQWLQNPYSNDGAGQAGAFKQMGSNDFDDEPPLLEELGIDPARIMEKTFAVLNPFHRQGLTDDADYLEADTDLAGPLAFCLALGATLLLSGAKANFSYIYGLAVTGCLLMYFLLSLMDTRGGITLTLVASTLGYCLIPIVGLSILSIFYSMTNAVGAALGITVVAWSSLSASRLFATLTASDSSQRPLIAYPCILLYSVFLLIVIF